MDSFNEELWYGSSAEEQSQAERKAAKSLAAQVGSILGARPFPVTAQRLSTLTLNPECRMNQVVELLESDPALSARLLRLVNSAGFALRTACTSVAHAATLVGIQKLNQVATTAAILDMYDASGETAAGILEHVTIVGALARYLGVHFGLPADELFTCGFLHDIGKLMLLDCEGELYAEVLELASGEPDVAHLKERDMLGYDHADLAGQVLSAWNIPSPIPQVVAWHHASPRSYEDPLVARMVAVLRIADTLSYALFRPFPEHEMERLVRTEAASYMELSEPQLATLWIDLYALAEKSRAGFRGDEPRGEPEHLTALRERLGKRVGREAGAESHVKVPQNFPCVVCGVPTYASECPACHGYVCPSHQLGSDAWCALCVDEFNALQLHIPRWAAISGGSISAAMLALSAIGAASSSGPGRSLQVLIAPSLIAALGLVVFVAWHRWFRRVWFLRRSQGRRRGAPAVTDQVASGAAPPVALHSHLLPRTIEVHSIAPAPPSMPPDPASVPPPEPPPRSKRRASAPVAPRRQEEPEPIGVSSRELGERGVFTSAPPPSSAGGLLEEFKDFLESEPPASSGAAPSYAPPIQEAPRSQKALPVQAQPAAEPSRSVPSAPTPRVKAKAAALQIDLSAPPPARRLSTSPPGGDDSDVTFRTPRAWKAVDGAHGSADGW